jgi:hypothetical protein
MQLQNLCAGPSGRAACALTLLCRWSLRLSCLLLQAHRLRPGSAVIARERCMPGQTYAPCRCLTPHARLQGALTLHPHMWPSMILAGLCLGFIALLICACIQLPALLIKAGARGAWDPIDPVLLPGIRNDIYSSHCCCRAPRACLRSASHALQSAGRLLHLGAKGVRLRRGRQRCPRPRLPSGCPVLAGPGPSADPCVPDV